MSGVVLVQGREGVCVFDDAAVGVAFVCGGGDGGEGDGGVGAARAVLAVGQRGGSQVGLKELNVTCPPNVKSSNQIVRDACCSL